jgi:hypothetical protein
VIKEAFADSQTSQVGDPAANPTQAAMPKPDSSSIVTSMSAAKTPSPSPLSELDQWVSAERLLEILWDEQSRPSLQWIRKETKRRMLPHLRRGRLIFYRPRSIMDWFNQRECRPNSMK